jgi:hypothetical protein
MLSSLNIYSSLIKLKTSSINSSKILNIESIIYPEILTSPSPNYTLTNSNINH